MSCGTPKYKAAQKEIISTALKAGYNVKGLNQYRNKTAILRAEINLDPVNGLNTYISGADRGKEATAHQFKKMVQANSVHFADADTDVEKVAMMTVLNSTEDMWQAVYTRTNSAEQASIAVDNYIDDNFVEVDIQSSGVLYDDTMLVPRALGIKDQESFDKVSEMLRDYYGLLGGKLQIFSTDPTRPDANWFIKDDNGTMEEVQPQLIRKIANAIPAAENAPKEVKFKPFTDAGYPLDINKFREALKKKEQ